MLTCFDPPPSPIFLVALCQERRLLFFHRQEFQLLQPFRPQYQSIPLLSFGDKKMMMTMSYFRTPRRLYGSKLERERHRESLRAALLVDGADAGEAAAAAGAVPKGYFAVYVGEDARRFVVPTNYLRQQAFRDLMELAAEEFGFGQAGGLRIPCREEDFEAVVAALEAESKRGGGGGRRGAAPGTARWSRLAGSSRCS